MKLKSQKGSITIFVLIALLFYTAFLLLMYASNTNKLVAIQEKSDILKEIYAKNTDDNGIDDLYNRKTSEANQDVSVVYSVNKLIFSGNNYVDTGIKLFDNENINKDFEISFYIDRVGENDNLNTLLNSKEENNEPYPGFCIRYSENDNMVLTANSCQTNQYKAKYFEKSNKTKIVIKRIANILYYSINDGNEQKLIDFTDIYKRFNTTVCLGASINSTGSPFRYFNGELSDVKIKLFESSTRKYNITRTSNSFVLSGSAVFNGKNYLDTGLYLFNSANKNKNFEISFDIIKIRENVNQNTLMNSLDENWSPWPGLVFRYKDNALELKANSSSSNKASININLTGTNKITIKRTNQKLYYKINSGSETELIDYSDLSRDVTAPLTFGASLDENLNAFRFFKGTLANIRVHIEE